MEHGSRPCPRYGHSVFPCQSYALRLPHHRSRLFPVYVVYVGVGCGNPIDSLHLTVDASMRLAQESSAAVSLSRPLLTHRPHASSSSRQSRLPRIGCFQQSFQSKSKQIKAKQRRCRGDLAAPTSTACGSGSFFETFEIFTSHPIVTSVLVVVAVRKKARLTVLMSHHV
jgi:hypothetical protein